MDVVMNKAWYSAETQSETAFELADIVKIFADQAWEIYNWKSSIICSQLKLARYCWKKK